MMKPFKLFCGSALLTACAVGPDYQTPEIPVPAAFEHAAVVDSAAQPEVLWWRQIGDRKLDDLIDQAIAANHNLRVAQANVFAARALLGEQRYEQFPIVTSGADASRQRASASTGTVIGDREQSLYSLGLDAAWELDFFGRVRRSVEAAAADYEAAVAKQRDVFVTVTAEVMRTYVELRGAQHRLAVARGNADNQTQTFELTRALLEGGRGTDLDIARAQGQLESTLATIPPLQAQVARAIHRLGVLTGQPPAALRQQLGGESAFPDIPEQISVGDPAALLRRRPDIRIAERQLASATARIGFATADLFPRVNLFGSFGYLADSAGDLGTGASETWSIGPSLTWAAFDLGRVRARIRQTDAVAESQLAIYEQTVLIALEETENALSNFLRAGQQRDRLKVAAEASTRASELARLRYRNGVDSFLTVLDAESRQLEAQDFLAQSEINTGLAFVALYKAFGGSWQQYDPAATRRVLLEDVMVE